MVQETAVSCDPREGKPMKHEPVSPPAGFLGEGTEDSFWQSQEMPAYTGHSHFWERALSRRNFVQVAGGASGLLLASRVLSPALVRAADSAAPKPIPGGTHLPFLPASGPNSIVHFFFPATGREPSLITDFKGVVGVANVNGTGTATDGKGNKSTLAFGSDNRFMKGEFIGVDGERHRGAFVFI
jgi:hypothetical protein